MSTKSIRLRNKVPIWNPSMSSLVLKFDRGRVLKASAKNFLCCLEEDVKNDIDGTKGILQFGKTHQSMYALDFRYPISPLQAFGIALSTFAWSANND
jgi:tubby-related protein 1